MSFAARRPHLLFSAAGKETLLGLLQKPGNLQRARTFPIRSLSTSAIQSTSRTPLPVSPLCRPETWQTAPFRRTRKQRYNSTQANAPQLHQPGSQPPKKPEGRFKELSRKYGWAAVGVYFGLSVLDFPFCFLAVRWLGTDRIAEAEEWVVDSFWTTTEKVAPGSREKYGVWSAHLRERYREWMGTTEPVAIEGPVEEAAEKAKEVHRKHHEASLGTQLALAYAVHKSLIFFRLPLTGAITPGIVKWLRKRGWNIGNPKAK